MKYLAGMVMAFLSATALAQGSAVPSDSEIQQAIAQLNHPEFVVRELAEKRLLEWGLPATSQLVVAAKSPMPETALRAVEILAALYGKAEFPAANSVEEAISDLRQVPGMVGQIAQRSWDQNETDRDDRTVAQLTQLGARVQYLPMDDPRLMRFRRPDAPEKPLIQFVVISRKWTGGDAGLKLLERLANPESIQIYHVNGAKVSEEAMAAVGDLGFRVDRRGAFLGISSNGGAVLGPSNGCLVGAVTSGSPADQGGMQADDRIIQFGEETVEDFDDLIVYLKQTKPGDKVQFKVVRNGKIETLTVELGDW